MTHHAGRLTRNYGLFKVLLRLLQYMLWNFNGLYMEYHVSTCFWIYSRERQDGVNSTINYLGDVALLPTWKSTHPKSNGEFRRHCRCTPKYSASPRKRSGKRGGEQILRTNVKLDLDGKLALCQCVKFWCEPCYQLDLLCLWGITCFVWRMLRCLSCVSLLAELNLWHVRNDISFLLLLKPHYQPKLLWFCFSKVAKIIFTIFTCVLTSFSCRKYRNKLDNIFIIPRDLTSCGR